MAQCLEENMREHIAAAHVTNLLICFFLVFLCFVFFARVIFLFRSGAAALRVVWVHNDAVIKDCAEFAYVDHGRGRFGLRIADAFTEDSGLYVCEVYNRHGEAESWCYLTVADVSAANRANGHGANSSAESVKGAVVSSGLASHSVATAACGKGQKDEDAHPIAVACASVQLTSDSSVEQELRNALSSLDMLQTQTQTQTPTQTQTQTAGAARPAPCQDNVFSSGDDFNVNGSDFDDDSYPHQVPAQIVKGPVSVSTLLGSTVVLEAVAIGRPEPCIRWLKGVTEILVEMS